MSEGRGVMRANESLPADFNTIGLLEAVVAPYQREDAVPDHPDLLFLWIGR